MSMTDILRADCASTTRSESAEFTVSDEMIEAGTAVLWASGAVEEQLGSDRLLVEEIYRAMWARRRPVRKSRIGRSQHERECNPG